MRLILSTDFILSKFDFDEFLKIGKKTAIKLFWKLPFVSGNKA